LHWAVAYNRIQMVKLLIDMGAKQIPNQTNMTPLQLSCEAYKSGDSSYWNVKRGMETGKWDFLDF